MILHACEIPACPWPCLSRVGRFLPLLALLVIFGVVQRCLFFTWRYLALLAFAGVACRSCTLPFANALSVLLLARWVGGWVLGVLTVLLRCRPVSSSSPIFCANVIDQWAGLDKCDFSKKQMFE